MSKVTKEDLVREFQRLKNEAEGTKENNNNTEEEDDSSSSEKGGLSEDEINSIVDDLSDVFKSVAGIEDTKVTKIKTDRDFDIEDDEDEDTSDVEIKTPKININANDIRVDNSNRKSILDEENEKLQEELRIKKELSKSIEKYEVTPEMYNRGQRLLAQESGVAKTKEKFNPDDYVVAAMIKQNKGRKPDLIPDPRNKWVQLDSFNKVNGSKSILNEKNSINCSDLSRSKLLSNIPDWVIKSPAAAVMYKKKVFGKLLKTVKRDLGTDIQRLIISNNTFIANGKLVNFNGVFGGDTTLDICDIVDFGTILKECPKLLMLDIDNEVFEVLCNEYTIDLDIIEVARLLFGNFNLLTEFTVNNDKFTRTMMNSIERDNRIRELKELLHESKNRNEFDAELKSRLTRVGRKSFKDRLKDSNRLNLAGTTEKKLITKGGLARGVGAGVVTASAFVLFGLFNITDAAFKGHLRKGLNNTKQAFSNTASGAAKAGNFVRNFGKK